LDVAAGSERHDLAVRQLEHELHDERRDVAVRADRVLPLADREDLGRHLDPQVVLDLHLAAEPHALACLAARDVAPLGGQQRATAVDDLHLADAARPLAAAGRRDEDAAGRERPEQCAAGVRLDRLRLVLVDDDADLPALYQTSACEQQQAHERQDDAHEHADADGNGRNHSWIPAKAMNPIAIRPVTMKVRPRPRSPSGTLLYRSFSRMAASATMASAKPPPDPTPNTTLSPNV